MQQYLNVVLFKHNNFVFYNCITSFKQFPLLPSEIFWFTQPHFETHLFFLLPSYLSPLIPQTLLDCLFTFQCLSPLHYFSISPSHYCPFLQICRSLAHFPWQRIAHPARLPLSRHHIVRFCLQMHLPTSSIPASRSHPHWLFLSTFLTFLSPSTSFPLWKSRMTHTHTHRVERQNKTTVSDSFSHIYSHQANDGCRLSLTHFLCTIWIPTVSASVCDKSKCVWGGSAR